MDNTTKQLQQDMLAHSLAWILTVAGDYWLGQCLSEAGEEIKPVLD